jgi:hypothetical protein
MMMVTPGCSGTFAVTVSMCSSSRPTCAGSDGDVGLLVVIMAAAHHLAIDAGRPRPGPAQERAGGQAAGAHLPGLRIVLIALPRILC